LEEQTRLRPSEAARRRRHKRKRTQRTVVGAAVLLLALVGLGVVLFSAGSAAFRYVKAYVGPDETSSFFESYIEPVVVEDPEPFSSITEVSPDWALETAIWVTLSEDESSGRYGITEDGREIVPVVDIQASFEKYFGVQLTPQYHTFTVDDVKYEYDAKNKCFYIPETGFDNVFQPSVTKIQRSGSNVTLTVDYIPGSGWVQDSNGNTIKPQPAKTMQYVLKGSKGNYELEAIKQVTTSITSSGSKASTSSGATDSTASAVGGTD
jgi:hypothetical protein